MQIKTVLSPAYLARVFSLRLRARAVLEGALAGWHRSPFHGYSSEFSQYKGYAPGDDLKHLDWKVYARRDQPVVRQYRDETNAAVHLVVDTSASMGYAADQPWSKLEYAVVLAASLALLAERQRDAVSLALGGTGLEAFLPPQSGPASTREVLRRLESARAAGATDLAGLCAQIAPRVRGQSFFFLFTDLWQDPDAVAAGLRRVRSKTRGAAVVQLRTRVESEFFASGAFRLRDLETGEELAVDAAQAGAAYRAAVQAQAAALAAHCARLDLRLIPVRTDWPCDAALRHMLERA